jgi:hypothetical protein
MRESNKRVPAEAGSKAFGQLQLEALKLLIDGVGAFELGPETVHPSVVGIVVFFGEK